MPIYSEPVTDLEQEYSPSSRVGGSAEPFIEEYGRRSDLVARSLGDRIVEVEGGSRFVEARPGAPLSIFVHGGYWQALSAAESMFLATPALDLGWSFAAVEYTLAPAATVEQMVVECSAAIGRLVDRLRPAKVVLSGHSAGAHLVAMTALVAPAPVSVDRVVLVSGVFDLRPLRHTSVNEPLALDEARAVALSPALAGVQGTAPTAVVWGEDDTDAFRRQSREYAAHLRAAGLDVTEHEHAGRHHFDIVEEIAGYMA